MGKTKCILKWVLEKWNIVSKFDIEPDQLSLYGKNRCTIFFLVVILLLLLLLLLLSTKK